MTCNVSLYSESLTINCESVRTIYLSNKIDEEIDTKIVQYNDLILKFWFNSLRAKQNHSKKNNDIKCRANDILQKFGMQKIIYENYIAGNSCSKKVVSIKHYHHIYQTL